jgi:hypothetical protein
MISTNSNGRYLLAVLLVIFFATIVAISVANTDNKKPSGEAPSQTVTNTEPQAEVVKYLPQGAEIADPNKDVIFADLVGDGQQEEIIFFTLPQQDKTGITVLKPAGADYVKLWEEQYENSRGFAEPTGVFNLNKTGKPQILAYHTIGASCPGALEIYQYQDRKIQNISGAWAVSGHCEGAEIRDLNRDKRQEIIITTRSYEANPDVYSWSGNAYVKANARFPEFYNDALPSLIGYVYSTEALTVSARIASSKRAVDIYLLQRRYAEAVVLCNAVTRIIDDAKLTKSNSIMKDDLTADQRDRNSAMFEIEKVEAKATIHHLLTDIYQAAANPAQALGESRSEKELKSKASEMRSKLPPLKLVEAK